MKKLLFAAVSVLCMAACNSKPGPERTTAAEFGEVKFFPTAVGPTSRTAVSVEVPVTSQYGFGFVYVAFWFDDDISDVNYTPRTTPDKGITSFHFKGTIPWRAGARKVTFRVCAITAYKVPSHSPDMEYTLPEEPGEGDNPETTLLTKR